MIKNGECYFREMSGKRKPSCQIVDPKGIPLPDVLIGVIFGYLRLREDGDVLVSFLLDSGRSKYDMERIYSFFFQVDTIQTQGYRFQNYAVEEECRDGVLHGSRDITDSGYVHRKEKWNNGILVKYEGKEPNASYLKRAKAGKIAAYQTHYGLMSIGVYSFL